MLDLILGPARKATAMGDNDSWFHWLESVGRKTKAGVRVNEEAALTFSACWCATRVISETIAMLPLLLYEKRKGDSREFATEHPLYDLLKVAPNPEMGSMAWREGRLHHQVNYGNAFSEIEWNNPRLDRRTHVVALHPIHPTRVQSICETTYPNEYAEGFRYRVSNDDGSQVVMRGDEMLHVPGVLSEDGIWGKGVIQYARESLGSCLATEAHVANSFGDNSMPGAVVILPGMKDPGVRKQFRAEWKEVHGGPNGDKLAILPPEGQFHALGQFNNHDAEFLANRQHNIQEIARWYRITPHLLMDLSRATFCLPSNSLVFAELGPKPIEQVQAGEKVWSRTDDNKWVLSRVSAASCTGVAEVLEIKTSIRTLRCTANHRVPVRRQVLKPATGGLGRCVVIDGQKFRKHWDVIWVEAGEIRVGDQLLAANGLGDTGVRSCPTRDECTPEFMEAIGMIIGNWFFANCRGRETSFGISHDENAPYLSHYVDAIESEFKQCDGPYGLRNGGTATLTAKRRDKTTTVFYSMLARQELTALGICGTAKTKKLPAWIFALSDDLKLAFLRGYLDSDGTVSKTGHIRYTSVNRDLLDQVRHLCISVGVRCGHVFSSEIDSEFNGKAYHHTLHSLICSLPEDARRIGTHTDFYKDRIDAAIARRKPRKCKVYPWEQRKREQEAGIAFVGVESIRREPVQVPVYDLCVEGSHTFIADGVLVHNSNVENMGIEFVVYSLMPWVRRWEEQINLKCLLPRERKKYYAEHQLAGLLRGDITSRFAAYTTALQNGFLSINECRRLENLNPVEGGDKHFVQMNLIELGRAGDPHANEQNPSSAATGKIPKDDDEMAFAMESLAAKLIQATESQSKAMVNAVQAIPVPNIVVQPAAAEVMVAAPNVHVLANVDVPATTVNVAAPNVSIIAPVDVQVPTPTAAAPEPSESAQQQSLPRDAIQGVLEDTLGRMLFREGSAALAKMKAPAFDVWLEEFHRDHRDRLLESLPPAVRLLQLLASDEVDVGQVADQVLSSSRSRLLRAYEEDTRKQFEARLKAWSGLSKEYAEEIMYIFAGEKC